LTKMNTQVDIIDILGSIKVPTLLLQRTNDIDVKIEEGKFIAERIKGARFVELAGNDHLFWAGDAKQVLEEMKSFILHLKPIKSYEEKLFTFVAARIITQKGDHSTPKKVIGQFVAQYRGNIIQYKQDHFIATFPGPNKAVHGCLDLIKALQNLDIRLAIGIQIKEASLEEVHALAGSLKEFIQRILKDVEPDLILTTQTVKNLLSGAGLYFYPHKQIVKSPSGEALVLFSVNDQLESDPVPLSLKQNALPQHDSFLETVLQCIDDHLEEEAFGVDMLCRQIGISERQLQRKLKAITNKSPIQLITSVRLHRAKELILAQGLNIAEISFQTGFSSPSYFSKCFKKEFGIPPSSLQNQL
ncbi:MAG: helix-turn-helix domain-containing protein, partial [Bacteroidota bacterium]